MLVNYEMSVSAKHYPKKLIGIYLITCRGNNKVYVGFTRHNLGFYRRWVEHRRMLRKGTHPNPFLQKTYSKYGEKEFYFNILEECSSEDDLEFKEGLWMEKLSSRDNQKGFNVLGYDEKTKKPDYTLRKATAIEFEFIDPNGEIVRGKNLTKFAEERGLQATHLGSVLKGLLYQHKGYVSTNKDFHRPVSKIEFKIVNPNGEVLTFFDFNLFCLENNLNPQRLKAVFSGEYSHTNGWRLENPDKKHEKAIANLLVSHSILLPNGNIHVFKSISSFAKKYNVGYCSVWSILQGSKQNFAYKRLKWRIPTPHQINTLPTVKEDF